MPSVSDTGIALASTYSEALMELAIKEGAEDSLLDELTELDGLLESDSALESFMVSPTIDLERRRASIEKIFRGKASDLLTNSLQVLNRKGRTPILRSVIEAYRIAHQKLRGRIDVRVETAVPLEDKHREMLKAVVQQRFGKEAVLIEVVNDSLIGGLVVFVGDTKLDVTISTKLGQLRASLKERTSHEIHSSQRQYVTGAE